MLIYTAYLPRLVCVPSMANGGSWPCFWGLSSKPTVMRISGIFIELWAFVWHPYHPQQMSSIDWILSFWYDCHIYKDVKIIILSFDELALALPRLRFCLKIIYNAGQNNKPVHLVKMTRYPLREISTLSQPCAQKPIAPSASPRAWEWENWKLQREPRVPWMRGPIATWQNFHTCVLATEGQWLWGPHVWRIAWSRMCSERRSLWWQGEPRIHQLDHQCTCPGTMQIHTQPTFDVFTTKSSCSSCENVVKQRTGNLSNYGFLSRR